ncbi:MAG: aminomethyl-transferring glycine dehydrogenase subunit GcvPA [bacterium]
MAFVPLTEDDRRQMLKRLGLDTIEQLLSAIPADLRFPRSLDIPATSELELLRDIDRLAEDNLRGAACFAGGGVYDHFIPAAVAAIISRPEFMTAYTPYQPEVSQGTLQVIYEFQTHICRLTGMDVANASMYDGATAAAEAVILAARVTGRGRILVAETVSPLIREVVATYLSGREIELVTVPMHDGVCDLDRLKNSLDDNCAGMLVAQPNFFGCLEEVQQIEKMVHAAGAKLIMSIDPIAQALLKTPGEIGADIAVGEGQPLGIPLSFGGPLLGIFAARKDLVRSVPGRIAARTTDVEGRPGFVLTLQTREQHIRRDKATSNICTNQALCATAASVYLSLMGPSGLKQVALLSAERAQMLADELAGVSGVQAYFPKQAFVREFAVRTPIPAQQLILSLVKQGILPGVAAGRWYAGLDDCLIVSTTEKITGTDVRSLANAIKHEAIHNVVSEV